MNLPKKSEKIDGVLPTIDGSLANVMPDSTMKAANKAIHASVSYQLIRQKCNPDFLLFSSYIVLDPKVLPKVNFTLTKA